MSAKFEFLTAAKLPNSSRTDEVMYPRVFGGEPLQALELSKEVLHAITQNRLGVKAAAGEVKPSNLAEVRARLKARKVG